MKKIIINLSPADLRKEGSFYDLPIALAILALSGQISSDFFNCSSFIGELSLDGGLDTVKGILSMTQRAAEIKKKYFFIPESNINEAALIKDISIIGCKNLKNCIEILENKNEIDKYVYKNFEFKANFSNKWITALYFIPRVSTISIKSFSNCLNK